MVLFPSQLTLVDKTDVSWWSMKASNGNQGLVPVNYIDKLDTVEESQTSHNHIENHASTNHTDGTASQSNGSASSANVCVI